MSSKNYGLPMILASVALSGAAFADSGDFDVKPNGCKGVTLCTAYADCIECRNMHLDIGFLYEQFRLTNTTFGYLIENSPCTLPACVEMLRPSFKLDWGLTASAGYYFENDGWFLDFHFDWIAGRGKKNFETCDHQAIIPTGIWSRTSCCCPCGVLTSAVTIPGCHSGVCDSTQPGTLFHIDDMVEVNARFKINYFMLEGSLNRASYISNLVSIEPHWGIKAAWIYYKNKDHFCHSDFAPSGATLDALVGVQHVQKTNFWGFGPHFGIDSKWAMCEGFSFFADNSVGILFGTSYIHDYVFQDPNCTASCCATCTTRETIGYDKLRHLSPVVRVIIGVQYDKCICDETQNISVKAGWDTHYYWNQWQHLAVLEESTLNKFYAIEEGTFGMVGFIVELGWDF